MQYPKFLNNNSTIGITAPSAGVGKHQDDFDKSLESLGKNGWNIIESKNVRSVGDVSSSKEERAKEFLEQVEDKNIDAILCATGGDFLTDMLPYIDLKKIKNNPKWIMGASDPTNLLYYITTNLDIATLYGHNASSFDSKNLHKSQLTAMNYLNGQITPQESYDKFEKDKNNRINGDYNLTENTLWKSNRKKIDIKGRIIGGCLDCLRYLPGTPYDNTNNFIEKYKDDGIIWYFDIFSMSAEDVYLTLFQLKETGWFKYTKGVIIGRVLFPSGFTSMTYERALQEIFENITIIFDADIGHVVPKMTIINGSITNLKYEDNKGKIEFELE